MMRFFRTKGIQPIAPAEQAALDALRANGKFDRYFAASGARSPAQPASAPEAGRRVGNAR